MATDRRQESKTHRLRNMFSRAATVSHGDPTLQAFALQFASVSRRNLTLVGIQFLHNDPGLDPQRPGVGTLRGQQRARRGAADKPTTPLACPYLPFFEEIEQWAHAVTSVDFR
jgi:hypothetical protein